MHKLFLLLLTGCATLLQSGAQSIVSGTFNIRYDNPNDSGNLWKDRSAIIVSLIRFHDFDILGTQEGLRHQLEDMQSGLPGYTFFGAGRDDGKSKGENSAIFYKKQKYHALDSGNFWLSQHPEKPGPGWDANLSRICSWLKLQEKKSKKMFYVFNVHYDHQGMQARKESSKLILEKIKIIAGKSPVIFTGDFNGNHQSEWYLYIHNSPILKDAFIIAKNPYANNGSFNSFKSNNPSKDIIDHIFISNQFTIKRYGILTDTYHGRFPSDHYPVLAELQFR